jgi:hypothetical protein
MPNTIWKSDTLLLGGPITDAFADALKDGSAKCKVTVGSQTEQKLLLTGGRPRHETRLCKSCNPES